MKFSLAATTTLLLSAFASLASADAYADAIAEWCNGIQSFLIDDSQSKFDTNPLILGLNVTTPTNETVVVAGGNATITVSKYIRNTNK